MTANRFYIFIAFLLISAKSFAQQEPLFQHNYLNPFIYNPGYAGINNLTEIGAFRSQKWADFDGGIISNLINVHSRINESNSSIGLQLNTDNIGLTSRTKAHLSYAFRIQLSDELTLQPGLAFGIVDQRINFSGIDANLSDPVLVQTFDANKTGVDANFGLFLKYKDFNLGFSMPQLLGNKLTFAESLDYNYQLSRQYILNTSYTFKFKKSENFFLKPDLLLIHSPNLPFHYSPTLLVGLQNIGWIGATYKSDYAISANAGLSLFDRVKIGLAYDIPIASMATISNSDNIEIAIIYQFGSSSSKEKPTKSPQPDIENKLKEVVRKQEIKDSIHNVTIDSLNTQLNIKQLENKILEDENILIKDNTLTIVSDTAKKQENDQTELVINDGKHIKFEQKPTPVKAQNTELPTKDIQTQSIKIKDDFFTEVLNDSEAPDGYYVVTGMYSNKREAEKLLTIAKDKFNSARILVNQRNQKYYVVLYYSENIDGVIDAIVKSNDIKEAGFSKAWAINYFKRN